MADDTMVGNARHKGLRVFEGYREKAYRLVFEKDEAAGGEIKWVETILPRGVVEMKKKFKPQKGKGLMTFGYSQSIRKDKARRHTARTEGPGYFIHNDAPDNPTYPLVQTWTVNVNDNFLSEYEILNEDQGQKDPKFHAAAISSFRKSMEKCFSSAEVDKYGIKCCRMKEYKENKHLVVTGKRSVLEAFIQNKDVQSYFFISADQHGFRAWSKQKGKWFPRSQRFEWSEDMDEVYVLYTRDGNSQMTCMMMEQQFVEDKTLGKEVAAAELRRPGEGSGASDNR